MLVASILAGDMSALEKLMRANNRRLFRTARAILREDSEAEEAVQDAYLKAYHALGTFRGASKLSTWLVRITANEALMRRRRNARAEPRELDPETPAAESAGPESGAQRSELRRLLEARIDALPEAYRAVFMLRGVEGLSVGETAAALAIPQATVRSRFFRARALLRASMADDMDISVADAFAFAGARCDRIVAWMLARIAHPGKGPC